MDIIGVSNNNLEEAMEHALEQTSDNNYQVVAAIGSTDELLEKRYEVILKK